MTDGFRRGPPRKTQIQPIQRVDTQRMSVSYIGNQRRELKGKLERKLGVLREEEIKTQHEITRVKQELDQLEHTGIFSSGCAIL